MRTRWSVSMIVLVVMVALSVFLLGFGKKDDGIPQTVYNVYLDGKVIGTIDSEESFEEYINAKEEQIKAKYQVDNVYTPNGVEIKKVITYDAKLSTNEQIYNKIIKEKKFTIKGIIVTIISDNNEHIVINVLNKNIFDEALTDTIKAFVDEEEYQKYLEGMQEEIVDTGSIIENIDLQQKVTYKEALIATDEQIFTDVDELAKYLLYGTTESQETYVVKQGDTIETVAANNQLNVREFLIANPEFTSASNLLYESQEVVVGLIEPIINVVVEYHTVVEEEKAYDTEIQYDDTQYIGYETVSREGENGLYKVVKKDQYINGQLADTTNISSEELKPAINKVIIKGGKYAPSVADLSYWAWPTNQPYTITSYFAWRWGSFHGAIDIAGTGYGSAIYAANNGVVVEAIQSGCALGDITCNGGSGHYVIINHNIGGYYTKYLHLKDVYVNVGQTVVRGQKIGTMGNTGNCYPVPSPSNPYAGTHLHFEVRVGSTRGTQINPLNLY